MAGRGRGRGRGRGAMSFEVSQLGFTPGESLPAPVLQPPPTFPPLEHKPVPLQPGAEGDYMIALRKEFVEYLRCTLNIKQESKASPVIERFLDKYKFSLSEKEFWDAHFHWDRMPSELRPKYKLGKRKQDNEFSNKSSKSNIDITSKLDKLAKLEEKAEEESEEIKEENEEDEDEEENQEEDEDDELDDNNDYTNAYFDNGEGFIDDEDDNLDDGPVYS